MSARKPGYTTRVLSTPYPKKDAFNSLHMPVYESVAFEFEKAEDIADAFQDRKPAHVYSRSSNPTIEYFEQKIAAVTEARGVLAVASGMAAIANIVFALVSKGENILTTSHLFGHTYGLFHKTIPDLGIETRFVDLLDPGSLESKIDSNTRMIFFETVTNPQLEVVDIAQIVALAAGHGIIVVADSTLTPCNVFNA
jgi:O-acetylhomoserine (thiol)-lyase